MKVLILGATGPSGTQLVNYALKKNHDVTAFVRDPSKIKIQNPKLHVVTGDARNKDDLAKAMHGKDAVLSGLGVGKSLKSNGLIEATTDAIVKAMKETGVRRLILISAFGVGKTFTQA